MNLATMRAAVNGSGGVVRRTPVALLVVDTSTDAGAQLLAETSQIDGRELYDDLRRRAASGGLPTLGALVDIGGNTNALLSGAISMTASTDLGSVESRPQGSGVYEQPLHAETTGVALRLSDIAVPEQDSTIADLLDLQTGIVVGSAASLVMDPARAASPAAANPASTPLAAAAGGAVIGGAVSSPDVRASLGDAAPAAAPAAEPEVPAVAAEPAAPEPVVEPAAQFEPIDLTVEPEVVGEPLPVETPAAVSADADADAADIGAGSDAAVQVLGVRCPVDHHNHPDAQYCSQCGRKMGVNRTVVLVQGPRPPLGLFVADDGTVIQLGRDVVIGRDPDGHEAVLAGSAEGVALTDDSLGLSRNHAMIVLEDWDVTVRDLESANGTFLRRSGDSNWEQLAPGQAAVLRAGDTIKLPGYELQLELFHIAGAPVT